MIPSVRWYPLYCTESANTRRLFAWHCSFRIGLSRATGASLGSRTGPRAPTVSFSHQPNPLPEAPLWKLGSTSSPTLLRPLSALHRTVYCSTHRYPPSPRSVISFSRGSAMLAVPYIRTAVRSTRQRSMHIRFSFSSDPSPSRRPTSSERASRPGPRVPVRSFLVSFAAVYGSRAHAHTR